MRRHAAPGFALPMTVLLLLVTTGAVITALNQASTERKVLDSETAALEALVLAETALERFNAEGTAWAWQGTDPGFPTMDSGYVQLADLGEDLGLEGYGEVIVQRLWVASPVADSALYVVRARGVRTLGGWAGAPQAVRVVTRIGKWKTATIAVASAWTSIAGLEKNGSSGSLDGNDACGEKPAVAGVAVPADPGFIFNGETPPVNGDPPILDIGATPEDAADAVPMDWQALLDMPADYYVPATPWANIDFNTWPTVRVTSPTFTLPDAGGQGILIAEGDVEISGTYLWKGIVLVGGKLTSNGNNTVSGATISGLNVKLGMSVEHSDVGNGTKTFEYNSCHIASAMQSFGGGVQMLENTWLDNWALY